METFNFALFPNSVLRALQQGMESVALQLAVASGVRDENQLTSLIFFARHPERRGQKLQRNEPQFAQLSTDPAYAVAQGIELVKSKAAGAKRRGFSPETDLFWHVVKLLHWLPAGVDAILRLMKSRGLQPTTWEEFRRFTLDSNNQQQLLQTLKAREGSGWDPARGIANVEGMFKAGR